MDKQRAALEHALTALSDGSGHDVWGPGVVGYKLHVRGDLQAQIAFDTAAASIYKLLLYRDDPSGAIPRSARELFIDAMRELAPVMLTVLRMGTDDSRSR